MYNFILNKDENKYEEPTKFHKEIKFKNLILPSKDYIEMGMACELETANEPVFPKYCSFYLTNDMKDHLYHKVYVREKCLTKIELVCIIFDWLIVRNAFKNIKYARSRKQDIIYKPVWKYASYLAVHGIKMTEITRRSIPVYSISVSS